MTEAAAIDIRPEHLAIARSILRAHLPEGVTVWAFGSRVTARARRYSDLDLAIDAGRKLNIDARAALVEAFSDSDLPYKVDVVDWQAIPDGFRGSIAGSLCG